MIKDLTTKNIIILGGGFGGVYALKSLQRLIKKKSDIKTILVSRENYFLFTPLLHEVATGGIISDNVIEPLRQIFKIGRNEFYFGKIKQINLFKRQIKINGVLLKYDYLIIAAGAQTNFFNTLGAELYSFGLKTMPEALRLKNHLIESFEMAARITNPRKIEKLLRFVIVGGGATGVEVAAEIADLCRQTFLKHSRKNNFIQKAEVILLQSGNELIPQFPKPLREGALNTLLEKNVRIYFNKKAIRVGPDFIETQDGEKIFTSTVIWVTGVAPNNLPFASPPLSDAGGHLIVNQNLQMAEFPEVFAIGDIAAFAGDPAKALLPALAQSAVEQAKHAAENIVRLLDKLIPLPFSYHHRGYLLSLGNKKAIGEIKGVIFDGWFAWWLWRTIYLFKIISWRKRFRVVLDWTINLFIPRDISRI